MSGNSESVGLEAAAGVAFGAGVLAFLVLEHPMFLALLLVVVAGGLFAKWACWPSSKLPRHRVRNMIIRTRLHVHPGRGHATRWELMRKWGAWASFRQSKRTRAGLSTMQRFRRPVEHSISLGRAHLGRPLRLPLEEHVLVLAPPRVGKSAFLGDVIAHYPGPVLNTTTKPDIYEHTQLVRAGMGPVHVFNPQEIGDVPSTFRWSPISGAEDPAVAIRRADGFANALKLDGDNAFFQNSARAYLRAMFHAAALARLTLWDVSRWALTATNGGAEEAEHILGEHGARQWQDELSTLRGKADRTNATNQLVLTQMLGFLADPALARAVVPDGDELAWAAFLRDRGTLYMVADSDSEDSPLAPLFACMASEVHYQAARIGQKAPGGRLDPPLLMALDEITQTCPVPVDKWMPQSGGKGIQLLVVGHGEAQFAKRWGDHGKQIILDTAGCKIALSGISDTDTLDMLSKLAGQTALIEHGHQHHSRQPIMTADMIRQLPEKHALIIRGRLSPVITRLPRVWDDPYVKAAKRKAKAAEDTRPEPVTVPGEVVAEEPLILPRLHLVAGGDTGKVTPDGDPIEVAEVVPDDQDPGDGKPTGTDDGPVYPWDHR